MSTQRQRIRPTDDQVQRLRHLFDGVPVAHRYDWNSGEGQTFIAHVRAIANHGVPISWLARDLGLSPNTLHVLLSRHRQGAARNKRGSPESAPTSTR